MVRGFRKACLVYLIAICLAIFGTAPAHANCQDSLLIRRLRSTLAKVVDSIYWFKESFRTEIDLHTQFALYPRARQLARDLNLSEGNFSQSKGLAQIVAFYARAGRELNSKGMTPVTWLKKEAAGNLPLLEYIASIDERLNARSMVLKWQEREEDASKVDEGGTIHLMVALLTSSSSPLSACVLTIEHELAHKRVEWNLPNRNTTIQEFVDQNLEPFLKDELSVRLAEHKAFNLLLELGISVPDSAVSGLTSEIWSGLKRGDDQGKLLQIVKRDYEESTVKGLAQTWINLYQQSDRNELNNIIALPDQNQFEKRVRYLFSSSLRFAALNQEDRERYITYLLEQTTLKISNTQTLSLRIDQVKRLASEL